MATPSEIITVRDRQRLPVSDRIHDVVDTTGGLTDELYNTQIMRTLGNTAPAYLEEAVFNDEPSVPTMDVVFTKLGIKDTKDKKAYEHFMEDFPKKANDYKSKLLNDPNWGERGWNTVRDLWRQAVPQYEQEKARKERQKEVGFVEKVMFPRASERYISGQPIQGKDIALDVGENLAMAVPGSGWMGAVGKIGRAGNVLSKFTRASRVLGNAAVPVASEIADDIAYDPGEGMDDRADFSVGDALLGTAINQGADLGVQWLLTPTARIMSDIGSGASQGVRDAVSQIGTSSRSRLKDAADANRQTIRNTANAVITGGDPTAQGLKNLARGEADETVKASRGAIKEAKEYGKILDLIDDGKIFPNDKQTIERALDMGKRRAEFSSFLKQGHIYNLLKDADDPKVREMLKQQLADEKLLQKNVAPQVRPSDVINTSGLKGEEKKLVNDVFKKNPDMYYNLFSDSKVASDYLVPSWKEAVKDVATRNVAPYVQNKLGRTQWAAGLGNSIAPLAEAEHKASREKGRQVAFSDILSATPTGSEDEVFIKAVRDNPDVLTYGLNSGDPATDERFKIWLLKGGHKKISGLPGVRPLWEVR